MARTKLTIVSSAACVMVKCGVEDCPASREPPDLFTVSLNSSDDDCFRSLSRCTSYDPDDSYLSYELQLENPQSKKIFRKPNSVEFVSIADLFEEEPINAKIETKTIPTNKPPIPIASFHNSGERRILRSIRSSSEPRLGRRGSLAIVDQLLHDINDHLGSKRRFTSWDSDNGSTSSFSSSLSHLEVVFQRLTRTQVAAKGKPARSQPGKPPHFQTRSGSSRFFHPEPELLQNSF